MKLAAFDIEIAKEIPEDDGDWKAHRPLGISCAALAFEDDGVIATVEWQAPGRMSREECQEMLHTLHTFTYQYGYTLVTWNGLHFDWDVLAEESAMLPMASQLCLGHVDLMFIVVALKGHYLALDSACKGMNVQGKLKAVTLNDGSVLNGMDGAMAPKLWARGEHQAVLDYLADDVRSTLQLARAVHKRRALSWTARSGRTNRLAIPKLYTVAECLDLPLPDTSWMRNPPTRDAMIAWMSTDLQ